jgi:hypothetical protein
MKAEGTVGAPTCFREGDFLSPFLKYCMHTPYLLH